MILLFYKNGLVYLANVTLLMFISTLFLISLNGKNNYEAIATNLSVPANNKYVQVIIQVIDKRGNIYTVKIIDQGTSITKIDSKGKILYTTYLGGSGDDYGTAIDVDEEGNIYVTGMTTSTDFPFTSGAVQQKQAGVADAFVVKINPNLPPAESIVYATYLGGSASDMGLGIKVDKKGSAYVTGRTNSVDFPATSGSIQPYYRGGGEAFVAKLSPDGSKIDFSTFVGGSGSDYAYGIDLDEAGNVYLAGTTDSPDFPSTLNAFQTRPGGKADAFAVCLNGEGNRLLYSSFFGGPGYDDAFEIKADAVNSFHLSGTTDGDLNLINTPLRLEQDDKGNFKAAFTFEDSVLMGKKIGK